MKTRVNNGYYWVLSLIFLVILLVGFGPQFFWRSLTTRPPLSIFAFFHALFGAGWIFIYALQVWLIKTKKVVNHMKIGIWSMAVAVGFFLSGFGMIYRFLQRYLNSEKSYLNPIGLTFGNALSLCFFALFIFLGYKYRRRGIIHKQFMTVATVFLLGPAVARLGRYPFTSVLEDFGANEALWGVGGSVLLFISLIIFNRKRWVSILGLICFIFTLVVVGYLSASGVGEKLLTSFY